CFYCYVYALRRGMGVGSSFSLRRLLRAIVKAIVPAITPAIIVTGIVGGVFTPTEAGSVAVVYAMFIGVFIYRELDLKGILEAAIHTSLITGMVMFLIFTSFAFSWVITLDKVP